MWCSRPLRNCIDLVRCDGDSTSSEAEAEEVDLRGFECALGWLEEQVVLSQDVEEFSCNFPVEVQFVVTCKDATVIHVVFESGAIGVVEWLENVIHELLHYCRAICWSKWHYCGGIQSFCRFEGQYVLGFLFNGDIIVSFPEVELAE